MSGEHRFRSHVIAEALAHLDERGVDTAALVRACGLPADVRERSYVDVPLATVHAFFERAGEHDPSLGMNVGARLSRSTWDAIQISALSAPTLGDAFQRIRTLIPLFNDFVRIDVSADAEGLSFEHAIPGHAYGLSRHGNELWLVAALERAREATAADLRPTRCWLAHPAPDDPAPLAAILRCERVEYGAGATGMRISAEDAARPLRSADPVLSAVIDRLASPALSLLEGRRGVAAQALRAIADALHERVPPVSRIARALGMSGRSFQRALEQEGTRYRDLVDQVRRAKARELLDRGVSMEEIAIRLGYSQRSAFVRAFARWSRQKE
jgi:AraC-like DNA-binding protein